LVFAQLALHLMTMSDLQFTVSEQRPRQTSEWLEKWDGHMSDGVGATSGVQPLAFLAATRDELLLCGNRGTFRFPITAVRRVGHGRLYPWLFRAIRIHHSVPGYPAELQFKPMHARVPDVLARLEQLGFPIG
jgi:hypothetical protein